jgi:integrase
MRQPKPFYRKQTRSFYVQLDDRQINLGPDEAEAYRRWHLLMAGADESVIAAMNEPVKPIDRPQTVTVRQLVKSYLGWQDGQAKLAPRTKQWYKSHLKSFESVAGDLVADDVTQADVDRWFVKCGEGWGDNYRLGSFRALSHLYNWGRKRKLVKDNPIRGMERPSYQPRDCYLTNEQWQAIIGGTKNENLKDILLFIRHTGCRPFEARWAEARHFDGKCIVFDRDESKGKKTRRVLILDDVALAIVKRRIEKQGGGEIFRKGNDTAWTGPNLGQCCCRLARAVKIPFSPYVLRHTAASNLLVASRDAVTTAAILGHTDVKMLSKVYGHLDKHPEHLKRLLDETNRAA